MPVLVFPAQAGWGEKVKLSGLGAWMIRSKVAGNGRNLHHGEKGMITPGLVVAFKANHILK